MTVTTSIGRRMYCRVSALVAVLIVVTGASTQLRADTGTCGSASVTLPFVDVTVANIFFCSIAEAFFSGLANGTDATHYSPATDVTREQMAAFITRTMDQSLKRGSERALSNKWFTPQTADSLRLTDVGILPQQVEFDGTDLWVANFSSANVMRIRPGDGKVLDTWTGATSATGIVAAMGKIFVPGRTNPGRLYMIDPTQPPGAVTTLSSTLGASSYESAFDGSKIWTANNGGSVSIVSLNPTAVTTVTAGFNHPIGMLYDGANIWVTEQNANTLLKLNGDGSIAQTINVGNFPAFPVFDGTNIWVPDFGSNAMTVVRVKDAVGNPLTTAFVLATLTGNGLSGPFSTAFDGERILVTNSSGDSVSLWKASDLTPLGSFPTGTGTSPIGACSDGLSFWIVISPPGTPDKLARF